MLKRCIGVAAVASALVASGAITAATTAAEAEFESRQATSSKTKSEPAAKRSGKPIRCDGVLKLGDAPKAKLVVRKGDSCTVVDSTIKSLRARPGSVDVRVYGTEVTRNLMVRGATGTVHIGPKGCRYDPVVGNNLVVRNSHNVLICFTSVDNNITVRNNDGRVTIRDSVAGNNLRANRNLAYAPKAGDPKTRKAAAIRLLRNQADNHIVARGNHPSRKVIDRRNSPTALVR